MITVTHRGRRGGPGLTACATVVATLVALWVPISGQPADRARTEALARRATERLQALQREADRLAAEERTLLGDLRKLEIERQIKGEERQQAETAAAAATAELTATDEQMRHLEEQEKAQRPDLRARLVEIYKLGQGRYARLLLSTPDLRRMGAATRTVAALAKLDRDRVAAHQRTIAALKDARAGLEERRRRLNTLRADAERAHAALERAAQARSDLIRDIDRRRDLNAQFSGELQAAQQKLQATLRDLARGGDVEAAALPLRPFRGDLDWPVRGTVRRRFSRTATARTPSSNGVEIAAPEGLPAQAVHDGIVAFADRFTGFGNLVILDHGSQTFSLYGHLLDVAVARGVRLDRGHTVGTVGALPTGPSGLYFELRVDGQPVDPLQWLKKQ